MSNLGIHLSRIGSALALPLLATSLASAEVPAVSQLEVAAAAQLSQSNISSTLTQILNPGEINKLVHSYAPVLSDLQSAVKLVQPLVNQDPKISKVDWSKVLDDNSSSIGIALNKIVAFQLAYDGTAALLQIGKLSGDSRYFSLAKDIGVIFVTAYSEPAQGKVPAYKNYSTGLVAAGEFSQSKRLLKAALVQETEAPYIALDSVMYEELKSPFLSRENALAIMAMANAHHISGHIKKGTAQYTNFQYHVICLEGHLRLWEDALMNPGRELPDWPKTVNADYQGITQSELANVNQTYVRPFMVALSSIAAVRAAHIGPESKPALFRAARTLHAMMPLWNETSRSFPYTDRQFPPNHKLTQLSDGLTTEPSPDLNGLIGGAYVRVGHALHDRKLIEFGSKVMSAGIAQMYTGPKQLNQVLLPFADTLLSK